MNTNDLDVIDELDDDTHMIKTEDNKPKSNIISYVITLLPIIVCPILLALFAVFIKRDTTLFLQGSTRAAMFGTMVSVVILSMKLIKEEDSIIRKKILLLLVIATVVGFLVIVIVTIISGVFYMFVLNIIGEIFKAIFVP